MTSAVKRGIAVLALLMLLLAQWIALGHGVDHAPHSATASLAQQDDGRWGHENGEAACTLLDHLLVDPPAGDQAAPLPCVRLAATFAPGLPRSPAAGALLRHYEARGPPQV